jgi:hypothetical protein
VQLLVSDRTRSRGEFADGGTWEQVRATNSDPEPIKGAADENLQPCQESPESAKVLKDLVGGGFKAGASGQHDGTICRAYSMAFAGVHFARA